MTNLFRIFIFFLFTGCDSRLPSANITSQTSLGYITDSNVIPTSFNESQKTQIKTTKSVFVIRGLPPIPIGQEVTLYLWSSGQSTVEWTDLEGTRQQFRY